MSAILTWFGRSRALLAIETTFLRALPPALLAALAAGAGAWLGAQLGVMAQVGRYGDIAALAGAVICAGLVYGAVLLSSARRLPLGRLAR